MRRSKYRRPSRNTNWFSGRRRIIAVVATLVAFGGIITVTQVSNASTSRSQRKALAACDRLGSPPPARLSTQTRRGTWTTGNGRVTQHADDGAGDTVSAATMRSRCRRWVMNNVGNNKGGGGGQATAAPAADNGGQQNNNGGQQQGGNNNGGGQASASPTADNGGQQNNNGGQQQGGDNNGGQQQGGDNNGGQQQGGDNNGGQQQGNNGGQQQGGDNNGGQQQGNNGGQQQGGNNNGGQQQGGNNNGNNTPPPGVGLGVLSNSCGSSRLEAHDGFQKGNRCVSTEFGEVGAATNNPSLLITNAPRQVGVNQPFTLTVSTRNLIRDRFLAAGQGGYYVESSVLQNGLVRGHFHTACRMLNNTNEAPAPDPVPAFFVATEDRRGGAAPDTVQIQVAGLPQAGTAQCASWAGDGSHRIPMMERANQTPAFDAVRIQVGRRQ